MSKFIVTGARGYVARRLIRRLVDEGHDVVGLTRGVTAESGAEPGCCEVFVGDYTNVPLLASAVNGAQAVFHLAARAHQRNGGQEDYALFHAANVVPTLTMAQACALASVDRFVMVSSIGVLGDRTGAVAFSDSTTPAPVDLYALSKANAERCLMEVLSNVGRSYCILRPPLVYGPGSPGNFSSLVELAAKAKFIPLAGVRAPRTFIYVDHLVDALIVAAIHPAASRRTFVIADDDDTSVAEIICSAVRIFDREPWRFFAIPEALLRALGILAAQRARIDKLLAPLRVDAAGFHGVTGWRPGQPTSEAIIATLRDWPLLPNPSASHK
jgi:nucleoside-diphosphate-sugar epimerase